MMLQRTLHYSYITLSLHGFLASPCILGKTKMQGKDTREGKSGCNWAEPWDVAKKVQSAEEVTLYLYVRFIR